MRFLAVIQARMSSSRMPGKVLAPLAGQPSILRQTERVRRATILDETVVATSVDQTDDILEEVLKRAGVNTYRGSLFDVLQRFVDVVEHFNPDYVVRLTGDCPLTSPRMIDDLARSFLDWDLDYASNSLIPSFPDGLDVEIIRADALRLLASIATDPEEREHVTLGLYRRSRLFRVGNFGSPRNWSDLRWTVDTPSDYEYVAKIFDSLYPQNPNFDFPDILEFVQRHPRKSRVTSDAT